MRAFSLFCSLSFPLFRFLAASPLSRLLRQLLKHTHSLPTLTTSSSPCSPSQTLESLLFSPHWHAHEDNAENSAAQAPLKVGHAVCPQRPSCPSCLVSCQCLKIPSPHPQLELFTEPDFKGTGVKLPLLARQELASAVRPRSLLVPAGHEVALHRDRHCDWEPSIVLAGSVFDLRAASLPPVRRSPLGSARLSASLAHHTQHPSTSSASDWLHHGTAACALRLSGHARRVSHGGLFERRLPAGVSAGGGAPLYRFRREGLPRGALRMPAALFPPLPLFPTSTSYALTSALLQITKGLQPVEPSAHRCGRPPRRAALWRSGPLRSR